MPIEFLSAKKPLGGAIRYPRVRMLLRNPLFRNTYIMYCNYGEAGDTTL
jgi:hypothetical protein